MNTREIQIEQARRLIATGISEDLKEVLEQQYPELKESEDERIRQGLLFFIKKEREKKHLTWDKIPLDDYEAYLEKQKEQKPAECVKYSVKFEEGFKAGRESGLRDGQKYVLNNLDSYGLCKSAEWSEEDEDKVDDICKLIEHATIIPRSGDDDTGIPPTRLNDKYKGELKAFVKSLRPCGSSENPNNHAEWSEEDEDCLKRAIWYVENPAPLVVKDTNLVLWLESLPEIFNLQPKQEWSEEDEVYLQDALWCVKQASKVARGENDMGACWSAERWLKSLRPQPRWKPSEEQPDGLHFTPLMRLIQKIPSENWNGAVNNYAKKLRDCLIKEGYRKDAEVLQGYISYMNGNNVPMATMDEQEQPEVDLEKEIDKYLESIEAWQIQEAPFTSMENIARHFYGLRNRALEEATRHVYESWMGGTMDDVRRDMVELGKVLNARK